MNRHLNVDVRAQKVFLMNGENRLWQAPVSTSQYGLSETPNSYCTPRGWHVISEKIGDTAPLYAVFEARKWTGRVWDPENSRHSVDSILTRILWLAGTEPHNQTTHARFIYFHGTPHEELIGQPASLGCIRLKNRDMLELYEQATVGMPVFIG